MGLTEPRPIPLGGVEAASSLRQRQGLFWLAITVLILCTVPRLGIKVGALPLYVIDGTALMAFLCAVDVPRWQRRPILFTGFVVAILFFITVSELGAIAITGSVIKPIYWFGRIAIAVSIFYSAATLIRRPSDLKPILIAATVGLIVTSTLMILSSFPMTRPLITTYIFSNPFLEPASDSIVEKFAENIDEELGTRGRSLVGVSILSGTFINITLPLVLMLYRWPGEIGIWRRVAFFSCLIAPMGVLVSYSRGAILGLILIVLAIYVYGPKKIRTGIGIAVVATALAVMLVGANSNVFMFDRLERRVQAMVDNPYADEREHERLLAYVEPFQHVVEHPRFLLFGEGTITPRITSRAEQRGKATHAILAKAYYSYGLIAAFLYLYLLGLIGLYLLRIRPAARRRGTFLDLYVSSLTISCIALTPWFVFGHAAVSMPRGAMMFFLIVGLVAATRNFMAATSPVRPPMPLVGQPALERLR